MNRPFPSCFELHYESEAKCKVFVMNISFYSYANKTNFENDVLFQKVTQAYSEKNPSAPIRSFIYHAFRHSNPSSMQDVCHMNLV